MKIIIAGSRGIHWFDAVQYAIENSDFNGKITEVVSGCCSGVDTMGESWAGYNDIPVKRFPAKWSELGRKAGPVRNREMAGYADGLIAVVFGESRGTNNMIFEIGREHKPCNVFRIKVEREM